MCLDILDEEIRRIRFGYKVFILLRNRKYRPIYQSTYLRFSLGKPVTDENDEMIKISCIDSYKSGFHLYTRKKDAVKNCRSLDYRVVVKVKVEDIVASGQQDGCSVVVCRKMTLIEQVSGI